MAGSKIELLIAARNEAGRELKLLRGEIHELRNAIVGMNEKTKSSNKEVEESNKKVGKSYIKNARTINDITHNIKILQNQQKSAVIGSREYTSSIKMLRIEQKKLASATGKMGAQGVQQFNRMRIATSGLRRTLGAMRNQILVFLLAWRMIKTTLDIGTEAIQVSKDAEEIQNKFDVVFKSVKDVTNDWAESFADSVGRARQDVKKFSSEVGDVLKPLGFATNESAALAKQVVELGLDVASFNNRQDPEVIQSFIKAITGERESLKTLGIVINEADVEQEAYTAGLVAQGEELSKTAKAQATINLLFKNSQDAQGDLARTSESLVNVEKRRNAEYKNMMERMGKKLIPLAKTWNKLLISMYELTKPAVNKLAELQRTMAGFERQEKNLNMMISQFQNLKDRTGKSNEEIDRMNGLMQKLGEAFPSAATFDEFGNVIDVNIESMRTLIELQIESLRLILSKQLKNTYKDFVDDLKKMDELSGSIEFRKVFYKEPAEEKKSALEALGLENLGKLTKQELKWAEEEIKKSSKIIDVFKGKMDSLQAPLDVAVKRIMSMFLEPDKVTIVELAAELGMNLKNNEKFLNRLLQRWKELQKTTSEGLGGGKEEAGLLFNEKELETLEKSLKKLYEELGEEQITLGSLDIDEGFERATFIMKGQIDQRIGLLNKEKQKLIDHHKGVEKIHGDDLKAFETYTEEIVTLEKVKATKLDILREQYRQKFEEAYVDARINAIEDSMQRQIAVYEQGYEDQKVLYDEYLEHKIISTEQYNAMLLQLEKAKNDKINDLRQEQLDKDEQDYLNYFKDMAAMSEADYELQKKLVNIEASEKFTAMLDLKQRGIIGIQELAEAEVAIEQWKYEQKRAILLKQFDDANHYWLEPTMAGLDMIANKWIESMDIASDVASSFINSFASIAMEWIKEQIKMVLISDSLKAIEVVKAAKTGTAMAIAYTPAAVAANIASFGGAGVAAATTHAAYFTAAQAMALGGLVGAKEGMFVDKEQVITVGEGGEKEVIIPISKFVPFLAGDYSLPGGFGIEHIPRVSRGARGGTKNAETAKIGMSIPDISNVYEQSPVSSHFSAVNNYISNVTRSQVELGNVMMAGGGVPKSEFGNENVIKMNELESLMRSNTNAIKAMNMNLVSKDMTPNILIESKIDGEKFVLKQVKAIENELTRRGVNLDDA